MQYFGKWYEPFWVSGFGDGAILDDFMDMGFVDYYTHSYITKPKVELDIYGHYVTDWNKPIKWKEDINGLMFFQVMYTNNTSNNRRLWMRKISNKEDIDVTYNPDRDYVAKLLLGYNTYSMCIQFLTLKNGGFLLDTCSGPYFGNDPTAPLPDLTMNIIPNSISDSNNFHTVIGLPSSQDSNIKEFIYIERGNHPIGQDMIHYNQKSISLTTYNDEQGSKTINTNIPNKFILTRIPCFDGFLENLYLITTKPSLIHPNDYFTVNNKTYLTLFNNYAVEVEMEGE